MDSEEISQQHPLTSSDGPEIMSPTIPGKSPLNQPEDTSNSNSNFPLLGFSDQGKDSTQGNNITRNDAEIKIKFETEDFCEKNAATTDKKCADDGKTTNSTPETPSKNTSVDTGKTVKKSILESALSSIPKITVRVDPETGKKFIIQGGKRYEIVPQTMMPLMSGIKKTVTPPMGSNFCTVGPGNRIKIHGGTETASSSTAGSSAAGTDTRKTLIVQGIVPSVDKSRSRIISAPVRLPDLAAIQPKGTLPEAGDKKILNPTLLIHKSPECPPLDWVGRNTKVKIIKQKQTPASQDPAPIVRPPPYTGLGINYYTQRYNKLNKTTMTEIQVEHKGFQINMPMDRKECGTQTDDTNPDHSLSMINDDFVEYILTGFRPGAQLEQQQQQQEQETEKVYAEPPKPAKSKEDIAMLEFFETLRCALIVDRSGNMPIHESVMQNDPDSIHKNCVALRARNESVNVYNMNQYTPLHLAILHDASPEVLDILLKNNADMSMPDGEGNTVFHLAVEHWRTQHLEKLLGKASQLLKDENARINLDVFNFEGFTPLIMSCMARSYEMSKMLLDAGADANVRDMKSGRTALFHAAEAYDAVQVELLIRNKADTRLKNYFGTCPHDAMFDLDDIPPRIKHLILGREHRYQPKKKNRDKDRDKEREDQDNAATSDSFQNNEDSQAENSPAPTPPPPPPPPPQQQIPQQQQQQQQQPPPKPTIVKKRSVASSNNSNRQNLKISSGSTRTGEKVGKPPPQKKPKFEIKSVLKKLDETDLKNVKKIEMI